MTKKYQILAKYDDEMFVLVLDNDQEPTNPERILHMKA